MTISCRQKHRNWFLGISRRLKINKSMGGAFSQASVARATDKHTTPTQRFTHKCKPIAHCSIIRTNTCYFLCIETHKQARTQRERPESIFVAGTTFLFNLFQFKHLNFYFLFSFFSFKLLSFLFLFWKKLSIIIYFLCFSSFSWIKKLIIIR